MPCELCSDLLLRRFSEFHASKCERAKFLIPGEKHPFGWSHLIMKRAQESLWSCSEWICRYTYLIKKAEISGTLQDWIQGYVHQMERDRHFNSRNNNPLVSAVISKHQTGRIAT